MDSAAEIWPRPYYAAGGGDAFLFYVVWPSTSRLLNPAQRVSLRCDPVRHRNWFMWQGSFV